MKGHVILSHGYDSGPQATKAVALAKVAERLGWRATRPDYRDLDATKDPTRLDDRIARAVSHTCAGERTVLAGSSMGAFISGLASLDFAPIGLFLMALPLVIPGYRRRFDAAAVPTFLVHGWSDEVCPVAPVQEFAESRRAALLLLDDDHRLARHVDAVADQFHLFLSGLE